MRSRGLVCCALWTSAAFVPAQILTFSGSPPIFAAGFNAVAASDIAVGDIDGDGRPDAAVFAGPNLLAFEIGPVGGPTTNWFASRSVGGLGSAAPLGNDAVFADVDGDGLTDLVRAGGFGGGGAGALDVFLATPGGATPLTWTFAIPLPTAATALTSGDFDGDGDADLACASGLGAGAQLRVFRNQGALVFTLFQTTAVAGLVDLAVGRYDADPIDDVFCLSDAAVRVVPGTAGGAPNGATLLASLTANHKRLRVRPLGADPFHDVVVVRDNNAAGGNPGVTVLNAAAQGVYVATGLFTNQSFQQLSVGPVWDLDIPSGNYDVDPFVFVRADGALLVLPQDPMNPGAFLPASVIVVPGVGTGPVANVNVPGFAPVGRAVLNFSGPTLTLRASDQSYRAPVAQLSILGMPGCGLVASFDGSASYAFPGRTIAQYEWDFGDGSPVSAGPTPTALRTYAAGGPVTVQLTVTDDAVPAGTGVASQGANVPYGSATPVAHAGGPYEYVLGDDLSLDATLSSDADAPCGDALSYAWDLDNDGLFDDAFGPTPFVDAPTLAAAGLGTVGPHTGHLRVVDLSGLASVTSYAIQTTAATTSTTSTTQCAGFGVRISQVGERQTNTCPPEYAVDISIANESRAPKNVAGYEVRIKVDCCPTESRTLPTGTVVPACSTLGIELAFSPSGTVCAPSGSASFPSGIPLFTDLLPFLIGGSAASVELCDATGAVVDELRIASVAGAAPGWPSSSGFAGLATRTTLAGLGTWAVERVPGLDSNGGADWVENAAPLFGREPTAVGVRGTDPRPTAAVLISEVDPAPFDYVELVNAGATPVDLAGFALRCGAAPGNGAVPGTVRPFPASFVLAPGQYVVVGDGPTSPAELPPGGLYVDLSAVGGGNLPLGATHAFELSLFDAYGRAVDVVRAPGDDDAMPLNRPRAGSFWSDFVGAAGRDLATSGDGALGRTSLLDTNAGADWRGVYVRSMGSANGGFSGPVGFGSGAAPLDARLSTGVLPGGLCAVLAAGQAAAGLPYGTLLSLTSSGGTGPILGLGFDALGNYALLFGLPPLFGVLDARGAARIDLDLFLPPGLNWDFAFFAVGLNGGLHAYTPPLPYGT